MITPKEAALRRSELAERIIKKLIVVIDEQLRLKWRGPGRTVSIRQDYLLDEAKVDKLTYKIVDYIVERYSEAGWMVEIDHTLSNSRWRFTAPSNLDVSTDLIY